MLLFIPYLPILLIAGAMTAPFYFFNRFLQRKVNPRESGKKLLFYLGILLPSLFAYIAGGIYLIIGIARMMR